MWGGLVIPIIILSLAVTYILGEAAKEIIKYRRDINSRVLRYQNRLIKTHVSEVENIYRKVRGWRHDYHNHIQTMKAFLVSETDSRAEHLEYLSKLDVDLTKVDNVVRTGNVMADAMLNSKLSLAAEKNIKITVKAALPKKFKISETELCVIVGNMLDNSIEACMNLKNQNSRYINIDIGIHKSMLYINVVNSADENVKKIGNRFISTKDSPSHGFGLLSIDRIVTKYDGFINRQNEAGVFTTEIMIPMTRFDD
jgi:sensor histidine kinase regulating citrate/malate metabolism